MSGQEISDILLANKTGPLPAICCQGLIEAAVTEDNLCKYAGISEGTGIALKDEKNYSFPVWCDESGRSHIMNSSEHSLITEYPWLYESGIRWFIVDARGRGEKYTGEMTRTWKMRMMPHLSAEEESRMKDASIHMSYGGITRSGFKRGLS